MRPHHRMNHATCQTQSMIFLPGADSFASGVTDSGLVMGCPLAWLAGPTSQQLAWGGEAARTAEGWLLRDGKSLAGVLHATTGGTLEEQSLQLYQRLFALTAGLHRYRIWNYVPEINAVVDGVENYVAFNAGRHRAYAAQFGGIHQQDLAAASAVGTQQGLLALAFVAGPAAIEHFENPLQTPAADYPERYGKRAPLFVRGSRLLAEDGRACWHLSGTASIRSSETIGTDFESQLEITLENIERILHLMAVPTAREAAWKIFLRDRRDLARCQQRLAAVYPAEVDQMMFLEADLCRADLLLELEGIFHAPRSISPTLPSS